MITIDDFLSRLEEVKSAGVNKWTAHCPCTANHKHGDANSSLSITLDPTSGKILVHCHTGCTFEEICAALNIDPKELSPDPAGADKRRDYLNWYASQNGLTLQSVYSYDYGKFADGLAKARFKKSDGRKDFRWIRNDANAKSGFRMTHDGCPHRLYFAGDPTASTVCVVEGEKDADRLHRLSGYTVVSAENGASKSQGGKWLPEYTKQLEGRSVYILWDNDEVGRRFAEIEAHTLAGHAAHIFMLDLAGAWTDCPEKGDISDAADALGDDAVKRILADLMQNATEFTPSEADAVEDPEDDFPPFIDAADALANMEELPEELIEGLLRRGDQMLIAGASKTSKSFLALELAVAVATGRDWLGKYPCRQGRVLYINGEVKQAHMERRLEAVLKPTGETKETGIERSELKDKLTFNHLRGYTVTISQICKRIEKQGQKYDLIVCDPLYTLGDVKDENDASAVLRFLRELGTLSEKTGAAVITVHHHSKGAQGGKKSIDRASGSGAFGRWFDAILDLSVLNVPAGVAEQSKSPKTIGMRLEFDMRNYEQPVPLSIWWKYPRHITDVSGELSGCFIDGDPRANLKQYQPGETEDKRQSRNDEEIEQAIEAITADNEKATISAVARWLGRSDRTVRNWLDKSETIVNYGGVLKVKNRK